MLMDNILVELFGSEVAKNIANKHKGGVSNRNGNDFETRYAAFLIAKYAYSKGATITAQAIEPVDDLQIRLPDASGDELKKIDYQCKDRQSLSWSEISADFQQQSRLNKHLGLDPSRQVVVVSKQELGAKLTKNLPTSIIDHSTVLVFHNTKANRLLQECQEVKRAVQEICAFPEEQDKLESVFLALTGIWLDQPTNSQIKVATIIEEARTRNMAFIRLVGEREIPDDIHEIFSQIQGFTYELQRGFFSWHYEAEFLEGYLPYNCDDKRFASFLKLIRKHNPSSFCDLEIYLSSTGNIS